MSKRRRPSSCPTSSDAASSPSECADDYKEYSRCTKRLRVKAPVLDGRQRGMYDDDRSYDEDSECFEPWSFDTTKDQAPIVSTGWEERAGLYKDANVLLHRLHMEHQRRVQSPTQQQATRPAMSSEYSCKGSYMAPSQYESPDTKIMDESIQVHLRYEGTNRSLGSIVQERMQGNLLTQEQGRQF